MEFIVKKTKLSALPKVKHLLIGLYCMRPEKDDKKKPLSFPKEVRDWDAPYKGKLLAQLEADGFCGKGGDFATYTVCHDEKFHRICFFGMGKEKLAEPEAYRHTAGLMYACANGKKASDAFVWLQNSRKVSSTAQLDAIASGFQLAEYKFDKYMSDKAERHVKDVHIVAHDGTPAQFRSVLAKAQAKVDGTLAARDLVNEPPLVLNPAEFAKRAETMFKGTGIKVKVLDKAELKKEKMGMMLAVAQAAEDVCSPKLIRLEYRPKTKAKKHIALVGKGVCYDTGGLSLKPGASMVDMKTDMSGAACVFGTMLALAQLKPKVAVTGYLGCVENGIGPKAYHPDDIITSRKGLTVEIVNTDAEGRLVLGDVLTYACDKDKPDMIVDVATLTGACMVALGNEGAAVYSTDAKNAKKIHELSKDQGEDFWHMPLNQNLSKHLKSPMADMKNCGDRWGGSITAALFLQKFVDEDTPWMHLDIAGPASMERSHPYIAKGGAGFGVRTLSDFVMGL